MGASNVSFNVQIVICVTLLKRGFCTNGAAGRQRTLCCAGLAKVKSETVASAAIDVGSLRPRHHRRPCALARENCSKSSE
jgi:hypothetical protein